MKHTSVKVCQVTHVSLAYLDEHSSLDPMMVISVQDGGNFLLKLFKTLDIIQA